jgi:hypothetical protein
MKNNKFTSLIIIAVIIATLTFSNKAAAKVAHRFHSSLTRIDYDSDEKNIKITIQMIAHDVLEVFDEIAGKSLELESSPEVDEMLRKYLAEHFVMQNKSGEKLELKWVGKEIELERVFVYFEIPSNESVEGFKLSNTQTNIIIAKFNDEKADLLFKAKDGFKVIEKKTNEKK